MDTEQTYEQVKSELIAEIGTLPDSELGHRLRLYVDKMVEVAVLRLDSQSKHYIEVGKAAEAFFGSMKLR